MHVVLVPTLCVGMPSSTLCVVFRPVLVGWVSAAQPTEVRLGWWVALTHPTQKPETLRMHQSGHFLDGKLNPVDRRHGKIPVDPKQDPFLKDFAQLFSAVFKSLCVRVNPIAFRDRPVVAAIIRKNLVFCVAECRLNVFEEHWRSPSVQNFAGIGT